MAKKKKGKRKASTRKAWYQGLIDLKDERWQLLLGIALILMCLYTAVALISYFFSWRADQDKVFRWSWEVLLMPDLTMANWLGRLGAFLSHSLMYMTWGIASWAIVYGLGYEGIRRLTVNEWKPWRTWKRILGVLIILPVVAHSFSMGHPFPWGGSYGYAVSDWLSRFVGSVGLYLFIMAVLCGVAVWIMRPQRLSRSFKVANPLAGISGFRKIKWPQFKSLSLPSWLSYTEFEKDESTSSEIREHTEEGALRPRLKVEREEPDADHTRDRSLEFSFLQDPPRKGDDDTSTSLRPSGPPEERSHDLEIDTTPVEPSTEEKEALEQSHRLEKLRVEQEYDSDMDPYDPTADLPAYSFPTTEFLVDYHDSSIEIDREELESYKDQIISTLLNYKIEITKIRATVGPTVTLYEIVPAPGVRISKIKNLEDDIALSLAALGIRIIAPIPGKGTIGIEVPNRKKQTVSLREVLESEKFSGAKMDLPIAIGKTIANEVFVADLAKMPHLLIAGATGQGKSVGINAILTSLLYKKHPSQMKLVLIDPKKVELFPYSKLENHFLAMLPGQEEPIICDTKRVIYTLNSLCIEMDTRYDLLKKARARNIREYNEKFVSRRLNPNKGHRFLPFIVLVIDEFADLIMTAGKEIEQPIARLAQLARAIGIHLILATQRPSVNIITGIIKANFPARIAFKVTSKVDSRTILDQSGADQLIGRGDLLLSVGGNTIRLQGAFIDTPEVEQLIDHIGDQRGYGEPFYLPEYIGDDTEVGVHGSLKLGDLDDMFEEAARLVIGSQHGSTSMIQRRLKLGYNRAGRIMDQLEAMGIVGEARGSKPREVLMFSESEFDTLMGSLSS